MCPIAANAGPAAHYSRVDTCSLAHDTAVDAGPLAYNAAMDAADKSPATHPAAVDADKGGALYSTAVNANGDILGKSTTLFSVLCQM